MFPPLRMIVGNLQADDHIQDAMGRSEAGMRLAEPLGKNTVLGNAVQHAVGADDRGVHRAGEHQHADQHHESLKDQAQNVRPGEIHGHAADQVSEIGRPDGIGDDHERRRTRRRR